MFRPTTPKDSRRLRVNISRSALTGSTISYRCVHVHRTALVAAGRHRPWQMVNIEAYLERVARHAGEAGGLRESGQCPVDADTARSIARYEQEAASHRQVFVEIDHVERISDWQMDGEAGHQAPNGECESSPPRLKTNQDQYSAN
jgi:hypothetical protein